MAKREPCLSISPAEFLKDFLVRSKRRGHGTYEVKLSKLMTPY